MGKGWFHMIADDRKESCNRRRSQTIAEPTVDISASGNVKIHRALCWRELRASFSSPEPTILLACGWDRELWFGPTPEVRESRTSRQIQQI